MDYLSSILGIHLKILGPKMMTCPEVLTWKINLMEVA
jgi:hypothetical protein